MPDVKSDLQGRAVQTLRDNDRGDRTVAAPSLYPHQWSWDAAFVAIGWSTLSVSRALDEIEHLLTGQWATGMIPHIVFSDEEGYFPGPERWRSEIAAAAPRGVQTSGICQPAVHGLAVHVIGERARANGGEDWSRFNAFLELNLDRLLLWHRWIERERQTHECGLVEIHHPWESGMDNSPRWDGPNSRISVGDMEPYVRQDTRHVSDANQRPTDADYDRFIWLVEQLISVNYEDDAARSLISFRVGDVFFTALHALSSSLLSDWAARLGQDEKAYELQEISQRALAAVSASIDPATGLARDYDIRAGTWIATEAISGFASLVCGAPAEIYSALVEVFLGPQWCGHPRLALPLPPTTSADSPEFVSQSYWRGPQWPVLSWLFTWALRHHGHADAAEKLALAGIAQLEEGSLAEYYDAVSGLPLGSSNQSWTAAAALAWKVEL